MDGTTGLGSYGKRCAELHDVGIIVRGFIAAGGNAADAGRIAVACYYSLGFSDSAAAEACDGRFGSAYDAFGKFAYNSSLGRIVGSEVSERDAGQSGSCGKADGVAGETFGGSKVGMETDSCRSCACFWRGVGISSLDSRDDVESKTARNSVAEGREECEKPSCGDEHARAKASAEYLVETSEETCFDGANSVGMGGREFSDERSKWHACGAESSGRVDVAVCGPNGGASVGRGPNYARNLRRRLAKKVKPKACDAQERARESLAEVWDAKNRLALAELKKKLDGVSAVEEVESRRALAEQEVRLLKAEQELASLRSRNPAIAVERKAVEDALAREKAKLALQKLQTTPGPVSASSSGSISPSSSISQSSYNKLVKMNEKQAKTIDYLRKKLTAEKKRGDIDNRLLAHYHTREHGTLYMDAIEVGDECY